jgi:small-conductance mechanosensitive channel
MMLLIRLTIWTLGFCIAVAAAGVPIDRLSLMLGALGVGIGFGLQNMLTTLFPESSWLLKDPSRLATLSK